MCGSRYRKNECPMSQGGGYDPIAKNHYTDDAWPWPEEGETAQGGEADEDDGLLDYGSKGQHRKCKCKGKADKLFKGRLFGKSCSAGKKGKHGKAPLQPTLFTDRMVSATPVSRSPHVYALFSGPVSPSEEADEDCEADDIVMSYQALDGNSKPSLKVLPRAQSVSSCALGST